MSFADHKPSWVFAHCIKCEYEWVSLGLNRCPSCDSGNVRVINFFKES